MKQKNTSSNIQVPPKKNQIDRGVFVKLCTDAIHATRNKVTLVNQTSGYSLYKRETDNQCIKKYRAISSEYRQKNGYSIFYRHDLIEHTGVGYCTEAAEHLLVEILKRLLKSGADATLRYAGSSQCDHAYLRIKIVLSKERMESEWEVDAWNPRIIDVSIRPNKQTSKNSDQNVLFYGTNPHIFHEIVTDNLDNVPEFSFDFPKPQMDIEFTEAQDSIMVPEKLPYIHSDYTLFKSYKNQTLDENGKIHYLQATSSWQVEPKF